MVEAVPAAEDDGERVVPLIDGLLSRGEMTHFVGAHGCGKSLTMASIAYHIATEVPWRNRQTHEHLVICVTPHDGGETRRRLRALAEHHGKPLPRHLRIVKDDIRLDPSALVDVITTKLAPEHGPCGLVALDYGHMLTPDWQFLGETAQTLRDATGAAVLMLQEGACIANSPGWDNLWRGQRSLDDLIVFTVEHMRRSSTVGRLVFHVEPVGEAAVIVGAGNRPTMRPKNMSAELNLVMDALVAHCLAEGDWTVDHHTFADIVVETDAYSFEGMTPKRITEKMRRVCNQLKDRKIVRLHDGAILVNSAWRKARMSQSLDDLAEMLHEKGI